MKDRNVFISRVISGLVLLGGGAASQIALWKTTDNNYIEALVSQPYLWIIYLFIGLLIGEHCLRTLKRKK